MTYHYMLKIRSREFSESIFSELFENLKKHGFIADLVSRKYFLKKEDYRKDIDVDVFKALIKENMSISVNFRKSNESVESSNLVITFKMMVIEIFIVTEMPDKLPVSLKQLFDSLIKSFHMLKNEAAFYYIGNYVFSGELNKELFHEMEKWLCDTPDDLKFRKYLHKHFYAELEKGKKLGKDTRDLILQQHKMSPTSVKKFMLTEKK